MLSVIASCFNEKKNIASCLRSIRDQTGLTHGHDLEIVVVANGCRDSTVAISEQSLLEPKARGLRTMLIELEGTGKPLAMNAAEKAAIWRRDFSWMLTLRCPLACSLPCRRAIVSRRRYIVADR